MSQEVFVVNLKNNQNFSFESLNLETSRIMNDFDKNQEVESDFQ
jgi:hypothetical protein